MSALPSTVALALIAASPLSLQPAHAAPPAVHRAPADTFTGAAKGSPIAADAEAGNLPACRDNEGDSVAEIIIVGMGLYRDGACVGPFNWSLSTLLSALVISGMGDY